MVVSVVATGGASCRLAAPSATAITFLNLRTKSAALEDTRDSPAYSSRVLRVPTVEALPLEEVAELLLLPLLAKVVPVAVDPAPFVTLLPWTPNVLRWEHHTLTLDVAAAPHARVQPFLVRLLVAAPDQGECVGVLMRHPVGARLLAVPLLQTRVTTLRRHPLFVANLLVVLPWFVAVLAAKLLLAGVSAWAAHPTPRAVAAVKLPRVVLRLTRATRLVVTAKAEKELNKNVKHTRHLVFAAAAMPGGLRHELSVFRETLYVS